MGIERRGSTDCYYRSVREGARIRSEYIGQLSSPFGELVYRADRLKQAGQASERDVRRAEREVAEQEEMVLQPLGQLAQRWRYLNSRCSDVLADFFAGDPWKQLTDPNVDPEFFREAMEEICLETAMSRMEIDEALDSIPGEDALANIAIFDVMETNPDWSHDHRLLVTDDYRELGGIPRDLSRRQLTRTTFATAGTWERIAKMSDTFAYIGADYPYAMLATTVCKKLQEFLEQQTSSSPGGRPRLPQMPSSYIQSCAKWAGESQQAFGKEIRYLAEQYPESKPSLCYGFDYMVNVYPLPGWEAAIRRAAQRLEL